MKSFLLLILCLSIQSCAKISYVWQQGKGQLKLLTQAKKIELVLNDPLVSQETKKKIIQAQKAREYFKNYWKMTDSDLGDIYQRFTQLDSEAVVHLVTCTPPFSLKPLIHDFAPFGEFPYLGFFSLADAKKKALWCEEKKSFHSWIRPVYAYSTLGYFDDPILSSFLIYEKFDFIEMIYHELFHKYFFIRQDVDFSENIANFVAVKMLEESIHSMDKEDQVAWEKRQNHMRKHGEQISFIVEFAKAFDKTFSHYGDQWKDSQAQIQKKESLAFFQKNIEKGLIPQLKAFCLAQGIQVDKLVSHCYGLEKKWSPPIFSGFLTYEKERDTLEKILREQSVSLYEFVQELKTLYKNYRRQKLFKKMPSFIQFIEQHFSSKENL